MLTLRCVHRTRAFLSPLPISSNPTHQETFLLFFYSTIPTSSYTPPYQFLPVTSPAIHRFYGELPAKDVVLHFREWFMSKKNVLFDQIFEILGSNEDGLDLALSRLNLRLSEALVLEVLKYRKDVRSCLKFFDWAGRQKGFYHTQAKYYAIFKILSRAKLMSLMLDSYMKGVLRGVHKVGFYNTLALGYAVAGKFEVALQLFGRMRFQGNDLDGFAKHVLLNALVEERLFDVVDLVATQIRLRGFESELTHSILVKSFCKQKNLGVIRCLFDMENSEKQFLRLLEMQLSRYEANSQVYSFVIDGAGHARKPELASQVCEMMRRSGIVPCLGSDIRMLQSYLKSEKISDALNFFDDLSRRRKVGRKLCNTLIVGLCKVNKPDTALAIFKEIREHGKKPSVQCYEELIKLMCSHERYETVVYLIDDLTKIGRQVSSFIGNILLVNSFKTRKLYDVWLCSRDMLDNASVSWTLRELVGAFPNYIQEHRDIEDLEEIIERCFPLDLFTYNILLRKLSMGQMDDACKVFNRLCQKGYEPNRWTYDNLVHGFYKHGRNEEAKRWLNEMFKRGFDPTHKTEQLI